VAKSVAEQNSVDLAWNLFMDEQFGDLRHLVLHGQEMRRFRQLVVNSVMATGYGQGRPQALRRSLEQGLSGKSHTSEPACDTVNQGHHCD
jgi:hypothetical protein